MEKNGIKGVGECGLLKGLSIDDTPNYEDILNNVCSNIDDYCKNFHESLIDYPSIRFGLEMALLDLENGGKKSLYSSAFTENNSTIAINGLVWMGDKLFMQEQIAQKLEDGYRCIKLKIGAINFSEELKLLESIRDLFDSSVVELRVDANGAFSAPQALDKLKQLSKFDLHSIEQPIRQGQIQEMNELCKKSPIPIALDEELIGINSIKEKVNLLSVIQPQYIILKPSLVGGFSSCDEWIKIAEEKKIGWWITSALESNIGLNAIAQYTFIKNNNLPQGLGTGQLYTNNFDSPLYIKDGFLGFDRSKHWNLSQMVQE